MTKSDDLHFVMSHPEAVARKLAEKDARIEELEADLDDKEAECRHLRGECNMTKAKLAECAARLSEAVEALSVLILHTRDCEKELTEELHHADFCGESSPLTNARATIAKIKGETDDQ